MRYIPYHILAVCCILVVGTLLIETLYASPVYRALVIGNGAYVQGSLENPQYDAQDMADMLTTLGFEVTLQFDLNQRQMIDAVQSFSNTLRDGDLAWFYYSGHGLQAHHENYLLPIGVHIRSVVDIPYEAVNANRILGHLEAANPHGVKILVFDACRDTPYKSLVKSGQSGLAEMKSAPESLIAYATAANDQAYGSLSKRNSIYTHHLLAALREQTQERVTDLFLDVVGRVARATRYDQVPWLSLSLTRPDVRLRPIASGPQSKPTMRPASAPSVHSFSSQERKPTPVPLPTFEESRFPSAPNTTESELRVTLRKTPGIYSDADLKPVVKSYGFRDYRWNPDGNFPKAFEEQQFNGGRVIIERISGLMWQQAGSERPLTYHQMQTYIEQLNRHQFAGYADWRIPTVEELASLLETDKQANGLYLSPLFETPKGWYWCWSADQHPGHKAWLVYFHRGNVESYSLDDKSYVRAVRP